MDNAYFNVSEPYLPVGRNFLQLDEDAQYATDENGEFLGYAEYWRDLASRATIVEEGEAPRPNRCGMESIRVHPINIDSRTREDLKYSEKAPRVNVMQRMAARSRDALNRQEDVEIFKLLNSACPTDQRISVTGSLHPENLNLAFALIEGHELNVNSIVTHPQRVKDMRGWCWDEDFNKSALVFASLIERESLGIYAYFMGVPVYSSTMCPKNLTLVLAKKDYVGAVAPFGEDVVPHISKKMKPLKEAGEGDGWDMTRKVALAVINDYAISGIVVC